MLPHAAIRLKQGFGRLIRSNFDRGSVVVLDGRIVTKSYGEYLLGSLPPARVVVASWNECLEELRRFYGSVPETPEVGVPPVSTMRAS
jgi:ATP-dependent DNA helicase DinG